RLEREVRPVRRIIRIKPQREIELLQSVRETIIPLQHVAVSPVGEWRVRVETQCGLVLGDRLRELPALHKIKPKRGMTEEILWIELDCGKGMLAHLLRNISVVGVPPAGNSEK